jgi:hypothetical protein
MPNPGPILPNVAATAAAKTFSRNELHGQSTRYYFVKTSDQETMDVVSKAHWYSRSLSLQNFSSLADSYTVELWFDLPAGLVYKIPFE